MYSTYLQINLWHPPTCLSSEMKKLLPPSPRTSLNLFCVRPEKTATPRCGTLSPVSDSGAPCQMLALPPRTPWRPPCFRPLPNMWKVQQRSSFGRKTKPSVLPEAPRSGLNAMFSEACWIINHAMLLPLSLAIKTKI